MHDYLVVRAVDVRGSSITCHVPELALFPHLSGTDDGQTLATVVVQSGVNGGYDYKGEWNSQSNFLPSQGFTVFIQMLDHPQERRSLRLQGYPYILPSWGVTTKPTLRV